MPEPQADFPGRREVRLGDFILLDILRLTHDLPRAHAAGVHRDHLVIEPGETPLVPGDQLRIKARLPVPRDLQRQLAAVGHHRFPAIAVAAVASPPAPARWWSIPAFSARSASAFFSSSSRPPCSKAVLASAPASNWSRIVSGIRGSFRRAIGGLLHPYYAPPHTKFLTVPHPRRARSAAPRRSGRCQHPPQGAACAIRVWFGCRASPPATRLGRTASAPCCPRSGAPGGGQGKAAAWPASRPGG